MNNRSEIFRTYLTSYFNELQKRNSRYSLRAFAKKLKMNPGGLSLLLKGKRPFSEKMIQKVCDELCLSPDEQRRIFQEIDDQTFSKVLEQSIFETLSNWVHDAFLSLIQVSEYRNDSQWLSRRLGISEKQLERVIGNLLATGLIKVENGAHIPESSGTQNFVNSNTTVALKKLQMDANSLSRMALENEKIDRRYHGTNTLTIDPDKVDEAKAFIRKFREMFCTNQNWIGDKARIYQLNVSLYPIDQEIS